MPQTNEELRHKFFSYDTEGNIMDNGIEKAEEIIIKGGGLVHEGWILIPKFIDDMVSDAIQFLMEEWDYGVE